MDPSRLVGRSSLRVVCLIWLAGRVAWRIRHRASYMVFQRAEGWRSWYQTSRAAAHRAANQSKTDPVPSVTAAAPK